MNKSKFNYVTLNLAWEIKFRASQVTQWVKKQPAMQETQETQVQSLGWEDPLEEGMAIHSSIVA